MLLPLGGGEGMSGGQPRGAQRAPPPRPFSTVSPGVALPADAPPHNAKGRGCPGPRSPLPLRTPAAQLARLPPAPSALSPPEVPLGPLLNIREESLGPFGKKSELPSLLSSLIASVGRVLWAGLLTALGERLEGQRQRLPWGRDAAARRVQEPLC